MPIPGSSRSGSAVTSAVVVAQPCALDVREQAPCTSPLTSKDDGDDLKRRCKHFVSAECMR
jgi:hypothetical protein